MTIKEAPSVFGVVLKSVAREIKRGHKPIVVTVEDEGFQDRYEGRRLKRVLEVCGKDIVDLFPVATPGLLGERYVDNLINELKMERMERPWWSPFRNRIYWEN